MVIFSNLCAAQWTSYIVDILALVLFVVLAIINGRKGFVTCFFGIVSTMLAFFLAVTLAKTVLTITGGLFGLQGWFLKSFESAFSKMQGFNADVSATGVEEALKTQNVSVVLARLVMKMVGNPDTIPAGTTLAFLLADATSSLAGSLISGVALFILVKLAMILCKGILNRLADKISMIGGVNTLLGAAFGVFKGLLIVCGILAILALFPFEGVTTYLSKSLFVGALYKSNPLVMMLGWFL